MFHNLKAFAAAIAGAKYTIALEHVVHKFEDLEANARSVEDRCAVEIAELG